MPFRGRGTGNGIQFSITYHAATNAECVDTWAWVADRPCTLVKVIEIHSTAASGGTNTADIKKTASGTAQAPASGTTMLSASQAILTDSTANIPVTYNASATAANRALAVGDMVGIDFVTVTSLVGCMITLIFEEIPVS